MSACLRVRRNTIYGVFVGVHLGTLSDLDLTHTYTLSQGEIQAIDWLSLFLLYLWLTAIRAVMLFLSYPLLTRIGYGLDWKEALVMIHGGLRGAVSILMALTISDSQGVDPR
jgi:NhaP-type Na+/H+ or K+/H+ antiporter